MPMVYCPLLSCPPLTPGDTRIISVVQIIFFKRHNQTSAAIYLFLFLKKNPNLCVFFCFGFDSERDFKPQ